MAKSLVIVESPAKAKTIAKYLGKDFEVSASMGHIRDLPEKELGIDIKKNFTPKYCIIPGKEKIIKKLKEKARKAEYVYLASDLDREGESIAWHLVQTLKIDEEKARRVVFSEITKNAIKRAFENYTKINIAKVNAQQARRILDRIVGYKLSPLLWKKIARGLSAGRVQSVAVKLIVEKEREIEKFTPEEYWKIKIEFEDSEKKYSFIGNLIKKGDNQLQIKTQKEAEEIKKELEKEKFILWKIENKQIVNKPSPVFNTATLQQQAANVLGFSSQKTMRIAQQLYEGVELSGRGATALITYMRTDSLHISDYALKEVRNFIKEKFGEKYLPSTPNYYRSPSNAQMAHEAIRPTYVNITPEEVRKDLTLDQYKLYKLIWDRFVACQMTNAIFDVVIFTIKCGEYIIEAKGRSIRFDGYTKLIPYKIKMEEEQILPSLSEGSILEYKKIIPHQHFTQPPPRYTEAKLIKTLEKEGIGRPSTYAPIITTIQERGYVIKKDRKFFATELGKIVTDSLQKHFPKIMDLKFTSRMEEDLDKIEEEKIDWVEVVRLFYEEFEKELNKALREMESLKSRTLDVNRKCPKCGGNLVERWSKSGKFIGCSNYPKCKYIENKEDTTNNQEKLSTLDITCSKCGAKMVIKKSKFGRFLACSRYPECKNTAPIPTNYKCPVCGGNLLIRSSKRGEFFGCSNYPKCNFTTTNIKKLKSGENNEE